MDVIIGNLGLLINATLIATPPLLLAALGSCFSERSGVVNIGIEGMMTVGAVSGAITALSTGNGILAFIVGGLMGAVFGLLHAVVCIQFQADQTIAGTAINFIGPGLAVFVCIILYGSTDTPAINIKSKLPKMFNDVFSAGSFGANVLNVYSMAYLVFVFALIAHFIFYRTKLGMHLRACGEHPTACESLGINVYLVRYICVTLSGFLAGLGGAFCTLATVSQFKPTVIVGQGFIAIAAVIFGKFSPGGAVKACLIFGVCNGIKALASQGNFISPNLISMIPYIVTIFSLIFFVGKSSAPAANGKPYIKSR